MKGKPTTERIAKSIEDATGVSLDMLRARDKSLNVALARGVYYYVCKQEGLKGEPIASYVNRSRPTCELVSKTFEGYIQSGDKTVTAIYDAVIRDLYGEP